MVIFYSVRTIKDFEKEIEGSLKWPHKTCSQVLDQLINLMQNDPLWEVKVEAINGKCENKKMKNCWKLIYSQAIRDVDEFVSSSWQRHLALHHLHNSGSSAVNGCRQNESPNCW